MKKYLKSFIFLFGFVYSINSFSQVGGLSYTISPTVEYNWFNDKSGIENGYLGGAQFGFGFGEYVELRANYQQGFSLKTDINQFGLVASGMDSLYTSRDISMKRYGGELKLNLSRGALLPYLTLGTGIQNLEADTLGRHKQIYLTTGLGIKFSAANRYTIGIQALRTGYRSNPINSLMNDSDRELLSINAADNITEGLSNYALRASLVLYLGGRKPGITTDVDNAYFDNFSGGFRGLSIPIEPTVMKINFHDDLNFRSAWLMGISTGLNVGPYVGIRGFYWKALEEGETTRFDDLTMYGGEARFKLNEGKGFTPWITLGGGQINAGEEYLGRDSLSVDDKAFAMGGLGIDLPFSKYVKATGYVRSILTSTENTGDISMPEDLKSSMSYGVSLNFILGKKPAKVEKVQQDALDSYLLSTKTEYDLASEQLKSEYDQKISKLEKQLEMAVQNQDIEAVKAISEQKDLAEQVRSTIQSKEVNETKVAKQIESTRPNFQMNTQQNSEIRMTPAEFQLLLRDIMDGANKSNSGAQRMIEGNSTSSIDQAIMNLKSEQKINDLERAITDLQFDNKNLVEVQNELKSKNSEIAESLDDLLRSYNEKVSTLQNEQGRHNDRFNDIEKSQNRIESGLMKSEGTVTVQSIDSKKLQREVNSTNDRIDDLERVVRSSFKNLQRDLEEGKYEYNFEDGVSTDNSRVNKNEISNKDKVAIENDLENKSGNFAKLKYTGMSGFAGFGVGGNATFNIGYRLHYAVGDSTNLTFMPETFFGLGSPSSFGIMANVTYALPFLTDSDIIKPYVGLGLGLMKVGDDLDADQLKGAYNFIAGTSLNVWKGDLYVDYTARNLFKYNQLIVGYRFPF